MKSRIKTAYTAGFNVITHLLECERRSFTKPTFFLFSFMALVKGGY